MIKVIDQLIRDIDEKNWKNQTELNKQEKMQRSVALPKNKTVPVATGIELQMQFFTIHTPIEMSAQGLGCGISVSRARAFQLVRAIS